MRASIRTESEFSNLHYTSPCIASSKPSILGTRNSCTILLFALWRKILQISLSIIFLRGRISYWSLFQALTVSFLGQYAWRVGYVGYTELYFFSWFINIIYFKQYMQENHYYDSSLEPKQQAFITFIFISLTMICFIT